MSEQVIKKAEYAEHDFTESLDCARRDVGGWTVTLQDIERVLYAWGKNEDYGEWSGGFIVRLKDGRIAEVTGWCDTTGWGCQDGGTAEIIDLAQKEIDPAWDVEPADLNALLAVPAVKLS